MSCAAADILNSMVRANKQNYWRSDFIQSLPAGTWVAVLGGDKVITGSSFEQVQDKVVGGFQQGKVKLVLVWSGALFLILFVCCDQTPFTSTNGMLRTWSVEAMKMLSRWYWQSPQSTRECQRLHTRYVACACRLCLCLCLFAITTFVTHCAVVLLCCAASSYPLRSMHSLTPTIACMDVCRCSRRTTAPNIRLYWHTSTQAVL
jgi:hypothetical protein